MNCVYSTSKKYIKISNAVYSRFSFEITEFFWYFSFSLKCVERWHAHGIGIDGHNLVL